MNAPAIFLCYYLTLSTRSSVVAWSPMPQLLHRPASIQNEISSRQHSTRLSVRPNSIVPSTEDDVTIPWVNVQKKHLETTPNSRPTVKTNLDKKGEEEDDDKILTPELLATGIIVSLFAIAASIYAADSFDVSLVNVVDVIGEVIANPSVALDQVVQSVESMGPLGVLYFGLAYTAAELLAIPAIPLAASAGYLFGPVEGTAVVMFSASIAAAISFVIGRTFLRDYVEKVLEEYPKFAKLDRAIGKQGFKLMLLLRLSPIFPFALSNYLYGASSINFPAFFWGTLLGFTPGTIAYVCTGAFGKALSVGGEESYPWFVYAGGLTLLGAFLKILADTATRVVEEVEDEEESEGR